MRASYTIGYMGTWMYVYLSKSVVLSRYMFVFSCVQEYINTSVSLCVASNIMVFCECVLVCIVYNFHM